MDKNGQKQVANTPQPDSKRWWRIVSIFAIVVVAALGFVFLRDLLSIETLRENHEALIVWRDANYALAALGFVGLYIVIVAFSLPGAAAMTLTGGFLFGIFPGALFCVIGATLGAIAIFLAAKTGLGDALHARIAEREGLLARMDRGLKKNEVSYLLLMRLIPAFPFFLANLAPAFVGVSLRSFAWTTFFGIMPGSVVYTSVGAGLGEVFARGETPNLGIVLEPHILGPIAGLCALAALPIVLRALIGRKDIPQ